MKDLWPLLILFIIIYFLFMPTSKAQSTNIWDYNKCSEETIIKRYNEVLMFNDILQLMTYSSLDNFRKCVSGDAINLLSKAFKHHFPVIYCGTLYDIRLLKPFPKKPDWGMVTLFDLIYRLQQYEYICLENKEYRKFKKKKEYENI